MSRISIGEYDPSHFESLVGQRIPFRWPVNGKPQIVELELLRVTRLPERAPGTAIRGVLLRLRPFSVLFRSAVRYPLDASLVEINHPLFEPASLLLNLVTPLNDDPAFHYYEAVFN